MTARATRAILIAIVGIGALYLSFELGRMQADYSLLDTRRQTESFEAAIIERDAAIDALERQVAILETSREIDRETYSSVEDNLAELQASIQAQEEELVFLRGIVSPGDRLVGLRIQDVIVEPAEGGATHILHVLLVQSIVQDQRVTGSVRARLSGNLAGEVAEFALDELGFESSATDIPYGFRYFQELELGLALPESFEPAELEIQVWPRTPRGETIVESFSWATISG